MRRSLSLAIAALIVPVALFGQAQIGLGGGYSFLSGDTFEGVDPGFTLGGHLAFGVSDNVCSNRLVRRKRPRIVRLPSSE